MARAFRLDAVSHAARTRHPGLVHWSTRGEGHRVDLLCGRSACDWEETTSCELLSPRNFQTRWKSNALNWEHHEPSSEDREKASSSVLAQFTFLDGVSDEGVVVPRVSSSCPQKRITSAGTCALGATLAAQVSGEAFSSLYEQGKHTDSENFQRIENAFQLVRTAHDTCAKLAQITCL